MTQLPFAEPNAGPQPALRVLRDTFSTADSYEWAPHGSGGIWRRRQIDGILRRHAIEPVNLEPPPGRSFAARTVRALALKAKFGAHVLARRRSLGAAEYSDRFYTHNARRDDVLPAIVLEAGSDPVAVAALKAQGFTVVAALAAMNSLWLGRPSPMSGPFPNMFHAELRALAMADHVFCISREEQWLLNNLGVPAMFLPYYPDEARAVALAEERTRRSPRRREFLICATRGNGDAVESFREQVAWIEAAAPGDAVFHVTGHNTEPLREVWSDPRFKFHGACPDDLFAEIKRGCAAYCVHQRALMGALTRIPDMLLSGLPVVANAGAARSMLDRPGVQVYDTPAQMGALLAGEFRTPPPPVRPVELEDALAACLLALRPSDVAIDGRAPPITAPPPDPARPAPGEPRRPEGALRSA